VVHDFEGLLDGTAVTNQIAGLTFGSTTALVAGFGLNEFDFPPKSGVGVVFDDGGAISIDLDTAATSVGAYFNYGASLLFAAYDSDDNLLGSVMSAFGSNLASIGAPGSSVNEFLSFSDASGRIARLVITGDALGGSFTMDDLTIDTVATVPEPATAALVMGLLALGSLPGGWMRRRR